MTKESEHEVGLLIQLARQSLQHDTLREQQEKYSEINYGKLLRLSYDHRVLPLVFHHIEAGTPYIPSPPTGIIDVGRIVSESQRLRTDSILKHAKIIFSELNNSEIRFMLFRGLLLATTVYKRPHFRNFEDIDLLVPKDDEEKVDRVLKDLGYEQGRFDTQRKIIVPYSKEELDFWVKDRQHSGSYLLLTDDPFTRAIKVDVHHKLTNIHDSFQIQNNDLLPNSREEKILGLKIEAIDIQDLVLMLCVHIHTHSRWLYEIRDRNDLHLSRFTDIFEVVNSYKSTIDWDKIIAKTRQMGINFPVALGLFWTSKIYGQFFPEEVLDSIRPDDFNLREKEIALRDTSTDDKAIGYWQNDFLDRLFDTNRYENVIGIVGENCRLTDEKRVSLSKYHF